MEELAKRAIACRFWEWMPGMLVIGEGRVLNYDDSQPDFDDDVGCDTGLSITYRSRMDGPTLPDLADPATLGCLRVLVCRAYGKFIPVHLFDDELMCAGKVGYSMEHQYAEALVMALESAE